MWREHQPNSNFQTTHLPVAADSRPGHGRSKGRKQQRKQQSRELAGAAQGTGLASSGRCWWLPSSMAKSLLTLEQGTGTYPQISWQCIRASRGTSPFSAPWHRAKVAKHAVNYETQCLTGLPEDLAFILRIIIFKNSPYRWGCHMFHASSKVIKLHQHRSDGRA